MKNPLMTRDAQVLKEAEEILNLYRFYKLDGLIYLSGNEDAVNDLFDAVVAAVWDCTVLKPYLPYLEFVHPSIEVINGDPGWVGHFQEIDNRKFFLSDIYDFLHLFFRQIAF